jgi:hypothetical protein
MSRDEAYFRELDRLEELAPAVAEEDRLEREEQRVWGRRYNPECMAGKFCPHGCGYCREATE